MTSYLQLPFTLNQRILSMSSNSRWPYTLHSRLQNTFAIHHIIIFRSFWFIDSIVDSVDRSSNVSNFNQWQSDEDWYLQQESHWRIHVGIQTIISQRTFVGQTPRKNCSISQKRINQKLTRYDSYRMTNFFFRLLSKVAVEVHIWIDIYRCFRKYLICGRRAANNEWKGADNRKIEKWPIL